VRKCLSWKIINPTSPILHPSSLVRNGPKFAADLSEENGTMVGCRLLRRCFASRLLLSDPNPVADVMFSLAKCCHTLGLRFFAIVFFAIVVFAVMACCAASRLCAETAESDQPDQPVAIAPPAEEIEQREIEQWTVQLDDDRFDVRQRAQQQLEQAGQPAIAAVAEVAQTGSLESSTRAINILLQWSESKVYGLRFAALENLARLTHRPRESAMAMRLLADVREQAALETIAKLGGRVTQLGGYSNLLIEIDKNWKGGNEGMKHLADVHHAIKVTLRVAPITDVGLESLANMTQVRVLEIHGTKISEEALKKIKQQLPTTMIDFRDGPMLGIFGDPRDMIKGSVAVNNVVKNGAANKAGIVPGDRITEINGEKLDDFTALTTRIATYQAGDTVTLTLLRKGKPLTVKVTFDLWGSTDNNNLVLQNGRNIQQMPLQGLPLQERLPLQGLPIEVKVPRR